ncbi:MAG: hypothetical protein JHC65_10595 [Ilumatobacteraceae bacterium]|nr:hypothetical protein [Ilumatobacteraceae bacterium]
MKSLLTRCAVIIATGLILVTQLALVTGERAHAVAPWTPASLGSSLAVWLDASDASTLTSSGGLVSEWRDKSGNARHAVQATSGSRPTLNGSAISISDYNKFMTGAMAANSLPTSIQVTVVFTASGSGRNGYQSHPFTRTTNNYPTPYDGYNDTLLVGGPTGSYAGFGGYADIRNLTTRTVLSTSMSVTKVEQYLNGTLRKTDSGNYPYSDVPSIFYVGTRADQYTHFTGEINEIVVTNELSSSDRASLGSYLGAKWAVSGFPSPPAVSVAPVITGTPRTGDTLSASTGSWTGTPTSYAYQWQRSLTSGGSLIDIGGATNSTYVVSEFDVGYFIKVSVSATNGIGTSNAASSLETVAVVDIAPTNTVIPVVTGIARTGATLTTTTGSWTSAPTSYTYQWKRANTAGGSYTDIASGVNSTYVLTDSDIEKYIKVAVIAINTAASSTAALSVATSVVVDLADSIVPTATTPVSTATGFTFTISNYSTSYTYALTTTKGSVSRSIDDVTVTGLSAGESATVTIAVTRTNYKPASKTVTGSAIPAATTTTTTTTTSTTVAPALSIVIQAPVTTVAQGQVSVATVAPTTTSTTIVVLGANGLPAPTTTTIAPPKPAATTTTTLPAIVTTTTVGPPEVAKVSAGETAVQVDGVTTDAVVTRENNQMVVTAGSLSATLSGVEDTGETSPLDSDGNIHLAAGDVIKISVGGFQPGSLVEVWLFSTPTKLGSAVVGADGAINGLFSIPAGIKSGSHRVVISAKLPNGKSTTFTLGILVGKISTTSTLTRVLIAIPISLAIGFGFLLPTQLRRRRKSSNA